MKHNLILRLVSRILIPLIFLFGLYVQFHGDFGPGGGFQAGVIFAAGIILYGLIYGVEAAKKIIPPTILRILASFGLFLYAMTGVVALMLGGNYLEYTVLAADQIAGQHLGILVIEAGVGITVMSVMLIIFFAFAERGQAEAE
jgi:multicomponent Na+:H+ antiporter subunit B